MDPQEMMLRLRAYPDTVLDNLDEDSVRSLKNLDIPKLFVRERFKGKFTEEEFEAGEAVLWLSYFAEREIADDISFIEKTLGKNPEEIDEMLDGMTFNQKIKFIQDNYNNGTRDTYISVLKSIKTLRNHMAHGRLTKLRYGKYSMADPRGQMKLTIDLLNSLRQKNSE